MEEQKAELRKKEWEMKEAEEQQQVELKVGGQEAGRCCECPKLCLSLGQL